MDIDPNITGSPQEYRRSYKVRDSLAYDGDSLYTRRSSARAMSEAANASEVQELPGDKKGTGSFTTTSRDSKMYAESYVSDDITSSLLTPVPEKSEVESAFDENTYVISPRTVSEEIQQRQDRLQQWGLNMNRPAKSTSVVMSVESGVTESETNASVLNRLIDAHAARNSFFTEVDTNPYFTEKSNVEVTIARESLLSDRLVSFVEPSSIENISDEMEYPRNRSRDSLFSDLNSTIPRVSDLPNVDKISEGEEVSLKEGVTSQNAFEAIKGLYFRN
ncbi:hypothetical protein HK096_004152 [Nowakowskiella sp. JEL0078]|nr:hypothetical protein HK096_004152 [Nowakowskiella sp. JEL0078]